MDDLVIVDEGYAYSTSEPMDYDITYYLTYVNLEGTPACECLCRHRVMLVRKYVPDGLVLDIGVGSGAFLDALGPTKKAGFDINPHAVEYLKGRGVFLDPWDHSTSSVKGWTFWDSLEHFKDPLSILARIRAGAYAFVSLPIFEDIERIKESKHYKPGEHLHYWTKFGFMKWAKEAGFRTVEYSGGEMECGRESIGTFALLRT